MTVDLVTIHHEGAGTASNTARGAAGGYTYWIGDTTWTRLRSVDTSFATLHFNHVSVDICLSGNRMVEPVTDNDIALIHAAFMDAHTHGEVTDTPKVQAHRDNNGKYFFRGSLFSTVCPGDFTMGRWADVTAACRVAPAPPVLTPAQKVHLIALDQWRHRVHAKGLREGDRNDDVAFLVDELVRFKFLRRNVKGNYFGRVLRHGVNRLKIAVGYPNHDGAHFGGDVADAVVDLYK